MIKSKKRAANVTSAQGLLVGLVLLMPAISWGAPSNYTAPDRKLIDPAGVDLVSGIYFRSDTFLTIGDPANGGLAWIYQGYIGTDSYTGKLVYAPPYAGAPSEMRVSIAGSTDTFYDGVNGSGRPTTFVENTTNFVYTTEDGTIYTFDKLIIDQPTYSTIRKGKLISILRPEGTKITINYDYSPTCTAGTQTCNYRVLSVVSNRGYALKYHYDPSYYDWLVKISAVNTAAHTCDALISSCDVYDNFITMTYPNGSETLAVTDAIGNTTNYHLGLAGVYDTEVILSVTRPNTQAIVADYDTYGRVSTLTDARGVWSYTYTDTTLSQISGTAQRTVTLKDPANVTVSQVRVVKAISMPDWSKDALGTTTDYELSQNPNGIAPSYGQILGIIKPEGNKTSYVYGPRNNVTSVTNVAKVGSGLANTVISANYQTTCTYPKSCNQPTWTKDAKLNQTDYTYDNNHGGVLTVTLPADQNALRQRTYNIYTAFDTGAGIVYRLTRTETCGLTAAQLSLTACPALATTSLKTMDYGTATTAPKTYKTSLPLTVTQTDGTASLSATSTYAYDNIGNVISVDGPLAGTADQSFTTYDANRRKIFEIGPIPGGTGTQKRTLVRHAYDGDGQETQTAQGYANSNATNGSDAVFTSYSRMTYDTAGRLIKTEAITTGNVVP